MKPYDWIVVGGGIAGSALSYELANVGFSVLLLEQFASPGNATRYSYGGIAYWSGTTALMRQLCQEGIAIHRQLPTELDYDTQFQELDLLLTIAPGRDPAQVMPAYAGFEVSAQLLSAETASELEPLLNRSAIAAALRLPHALVSPEATVAAYNRAFERAGGLIQIAQVTGLLQSAGRITGVKTATASIAAANVAICTGGISRALLKAAGLSVPLYFTQAELIETAPLDRQLRTIVMPAELKRFAMEAEAGRRETDALWDEGGQEVVPAVLDAGAVQFRDGRLRMGQISRTLTNPEAPVDAAASEAAIRRAVGQLLPAFEQVPGEWRRCLVAFSGDRLPLVGPIGNMTGIYLFSGFSSPFALLPPLARRFAGQAAGRADALMDQLSPQRFTAAPHS